MSEQRTLLVDQAERENLSTFLDRALRLDPAAVVRLRRRGPEHVSVWVHTGFAALATRTVTARLGVDDVTVGADTVLAGLSQEGAIDLGFSLDSAWRGALPPAKGFTQVEDVPARTLLELAEQGVTLARTHGSAHGPPTGLLEQTVLTVTGEHAPVQVPMRMVFALTAMDFIPTDEQGTPTPAEEPVRVRATTTWLRLDARYGSIARQRSGGIPLTPR